MITYGYISTLDSKESFSKQKKELRLAGCHVFYRDLCCSEALHRKGWQALMDVTKPGDRIVFCQFDRIGNSIQTTLELLHQLYRQGIHFCSLEDGIDSQLMSDSGLFDIIISLLKCSRSHISSRTQIGLQKAKQRGRVGGRPKALDQSMISKIRSAYENRTQSIQEICSQWGISRPTFYKYLKTASGYS